MGELIAYKFTLSFKESQWIFGYLYANPWLIGNDSLADMKQFLQGCTMAYRG